MGTFRQGLLPPLATCGCSSVGWGLFGSVMEGLAFLLESGLCMVPPPHFGLSDRDAIGGNFKTFA